MEYGLRLATPGPLPPDPRTLCGDELRELLPAGALRALYFGSEFCEDLLPDLAETQEFCALAREAGVEAVLLTPLLRPEGLLRLQKLLAAIAGAGLAPAVVFSDWGVLRLLRAKHPGLTLRAGRLLNRGLRDPRLADEAAGGKAQETTRGGQLRALLQRSGVAAVETDADLEGSYLGDPAPGLQRVLHLPFSFVATGRNCLFKAEQHHEPKNFAQLLSAGCHAPCRGRWHPVERADLARPLWRAGNTLFQEVPASWIEPHLRRADRVVIHERPMP